jgi:quercetin dioxygenase-like cupin family protein
MAKMIASPAVIPAAGNPPKVIEEFVGLVNTRTPGVSIARMKSPAGWTEPGQTPEFDEYTVVLRGLLRVETRDRTYDLKAGQAIILSRGEWVRYATPEGDGSEYISVCFPAFSPRAAHKDE